jgi:MFS transporter, CP family, cyanate transporter
MAAAVRSHQRLALIGIVATAATLRVAVVGVGPLLDTLRADVGMSRPVAGLLTTIPYTCMGLFAFAGMRVVARLGYGVLVQACLLVLAIASLVRAVMPSAGLLLLMTVPIGVAVALIGVALPPVVKHRFADRGGQVTGAWVAAMGLGATVAGLTAVPLADALGGWRAALALTAIPPAVAIPLWAWTRAQRIPRPHPAAIPRPPWRTLMPLALVFGLQAVAYTGTIAWSAPLLSQEGFSDVAAGAAPAVISFAALPFALLVPGLSDGRDRRRWIAVSAAVMAAGAFWGVRAFDRAMAVAGDLRDRGRAAVPPLADTAARRRARRERGRGALDVDARDRLRALHPRPGAHRSASRRLRQLHAPHRRPGRMRRRGGAHRTAGPSGLWSRGVARAGRARLTCDRNHCWPWCQVLRWPAP